MPKKLLISGATGLVGQQIVSYCYQNNISVNYLTTDKSKIKSKSDYKGYFWQPDLEIIDESCWEDVDGVIHLAGCSVSKPWKRDCKETILRSRVDGLNLLFNSLKNIKTHRVRQIISASGISIYPHSFSNISDENITETDDTFLSEVVLRWEESLWQFETINIMSTAIRTGVVLDAKQGALPEVARPIRMGFGAPIDSGNQWVSWIHINDLARIFLMLYEQSLTGIYNGVAPNPVTNKILTKSIAKQLNKRLWLPNIPAVIIKMLLGERSDLLLRSQRVSSEKIQNTGFEFDYPTIESALAQLLSQ